MACVVWVLAHPGLALAIEESVEAEVKSLGLPQFDYTTYSSQLFWMFVTFTICYLVFSGKILPEISAVIQNRQERIENDLQTAKALREEIDEVREDYEQALTDARQKASEKIQQMDQEARAIAEHETRAFNENAMTKIAEFEASTETMKNKALSEIRGNVAEAACVICDKTAGLSVTHDDALDHIDGKLGIGKAA